MVDQRVIYNLLHRAYKSKATKYAFLPLMVLLISSSYLLKNYQGLDQPINGIEIIVNGKSDIKDQVVYLTDSTEATTQFREAFFVKSINDSTWLVDLLRKRTVRRFKLYFPYSFDSLQIKQVNLLSGMAKSEIGVYRFGSGSNLGVVKNKKDNSVFLRSTSQNSYLESPKFFYSVDYLAILFTLSILVVVSFSLLVLYNSLLAKDFPIQSLSLTDIAVIAFLSSITLPQRFINLTLAVSIILLIRRFSFRSFISKKGNWVFIQYFLVLMISAYVVSYNEPSTKNLGKYFGFVLMPFYFSCVSNDKLLKYLVLTTILIGWCLLIFASIDVGIHQNMEVASFNQFSPDPIYYSYVLAFLVFYVELTFTSRNRHILQLVMICLLVLCGSKLVLGFTIVGFAIISIRNLLAFFLIIITSLLIFIFEPVQDRFASIARMDDLTILTEDFIKNPDDSRINGFTLRVMLWQESIKSLDGWNSVLLGRGVNEADHEILKQRLIKRGLVNHAGFNSHNQYINTLYCTGLVGIFSLIGILIFGFLFAIKYDSKLMVVVISLLLFAMVTESVFERLRGILFFCSIILALMNGLKGQTKRVLQ